MTPNQIIEAVRELTQGGSPHDDISRLLRRHRCHYLLSKHCPPTQQNAAERALNCIAAKQRYKTCEVLFRRLHVPYAVIKGAVLSHAIYNDPFVRTSGDIDILIRRRDADAVKELLLSLGFVQGRVTDNGIVPFTRREILFQTAMTHQTAPYIIETKNPLCPYVNLDINMDILWGESEEKADMDFVLSHTEVASLFDISFSKLSPAMEFVSLCLHHYKDMNSLYLLINGSLRLGLFCEIYDYLRNVRPDAIRVREICEKLNVGQYINVCLLQTYTIFEDEIIKEYLSPHKSVSDLIHSYGLNTKERKTWEIGLLERLFHPDLPQYISERLTNEEMEKVKINQELM